MNVSLMPLPDKSEENTGKLQDDHQTLLDIIEFLPDATFVIDINGKVITWNKAIEEMTGVAKASMVGQNHFAYSVPFYGEPRPMLIDLISMASDRINDFYQNLECKDGKLYFEQYVPAVYHGKGAFLWATAAPLYNSKGEIIGAIESIRDVTERKRAEEQLKYLSLHDPLTALYNRTFYEAEINRFGKEYRNIGLMICDVDRLKYVNDTNGHQAGDRLLIEIANIIKESLSEDEKAMRIGGDEFAVIFSTPDLQKIEATKCRIQTTIKKHNKENVGNLLSISIGYAIGGAENIDHKVIFAEADNNMYREKFKRNKKPQRHY